MGHRRIALVFAAGGAMALAARVLVLAQPPAATNQSVSPASGGESVPSSAPLIQPPEPPANAAATNETSIPAGGAAHLAGAETPPAPPPAPSTPVRSPAAVLQALDKVTAETMQFAAPVGQPVRYKNLVFTVKACETSGLGEASPQAAAYVVVESAPVASLGFAAPETKEVFHGWMYADSPALHPLQHPIYDAWLIACMASAPKT